MKKIVLVAFACLLSGCVSSSNYERRALQHEKAARYYDSIGQHQVAAQSRKQANKNRQNSSEVLPLLVELWELISDKDD